MANIKSAKKRVLQDAKKTLRNKIVKSQTQTAIKKLKKLHLSAKDGNKRDEAAQLLKEANALVDKAANKGIYHRNKSARTKSRLTKYFVRTFVDTDKTTQAKPVSSDSSTK